MTIDDLALLITTSGLQLVRDGFYSNSCGQRGYVAEYQSLGMFLKYAVSSAEFALAPDDGFHGD
jgi:hypothetical protein